MATEPPVLSCPICYEDSVPTPDKVFGFRCGHVYCRDCAHAHLQSKINSGQLLDISCPDPSCTATIPLDDVRQLLSDPEFDRYEEMATAALLRVQALVSFCPKCKQAALLNSIGPRAVQQATTVQCLSCKHRYCSKCDRSPHPEGEVCRDRASDTDDDPVEDSRKQPENDDKTKEWLREHHSKQCPKCRMWVEKNKGCQHMTCANCEHQFCWICMQPYTLNHYNQGSCRGLQFADLDNVPPNRMRRARLWERFKRSSKLAGTGVVVVVFGIPAVVIVGAGYVVFQVLKCVLCTR